MIRRIEATLAHMRRVYQRDDLIIATWPHVNGGPRPVRKRRSPGLRGLPSRLRMRHDRAEETVQPVQRQRQLQQLAA